MSEFQPIESLAPYKDLVPQEDRASELQRFVTEWLAPQLAEINRLREVAVHKGIMYQMGLTALGVNSQLSSWIPRAQRYRRQRKQETGDSVRARAAADAKAVPPIKWTEARIKDHIDAELALWDALIDSLRSVREDMMTIISFTQSTMRWMQTEEFQGNLQS
jgi:hypothetical protein